MLAKRLAILRGTRTQQEVADALGISRARYAHYENGRNEPDINMLIRMADFFQVNVDDLLGRSDTIKDGKADYQPTVFDEARELAELFKRDPESHKFWISYKNASPKKRKEFLRTWHIMTELEKKDE